MPRRPGGGRPLELTEEKIVTYCTVIRNGGSHIAASKACGFSYATTRKWRIAGEDEVSPLFIKFNDQVRKSESECEQALSDHWYRIATTDTNWQSVAALLERRFPASWARFDKKKRNEEIKKLKAETICLQMKAKALEALAGDPLAEQKVEYIIRDFEAEMARRNKAKAEEEAS